MKTILRFLWRNRAAVIAGIQLAREYGPAAWDYTKQKTTETIKKLRQWLKLELKH